MSSSKGSPECDSDLVGVILAAGRGVRAYPSTKHMPKALLEVGGKPLIQRNVEILRDQLNISKFYIVIGYLGEQIVGHFGKHSLGVDIQFVEQPVQKGIGDALMKVEAVLTADRFVVVLADELYLGSNHSKLISLMTPDHDAVIGFFEENERNVISKNYTAIVQNSRILSLEEKPKFPETSLMGVGTYLLTKKVFHYLRTTPPSILRGEVEITDALSNMAQNENVALCVLEGDYINVNTVDDANMANYKVHDRQFGDYSVSVVIPAYNEEFTIAKVVEDFKSHSHVDEVLVIDNNSSDQTGERARQAGARVLVETKQGYGNALQRGMKEASGDIMILTEADGSFHSKDVSKFLEYLKDCDMVMGTRTTRQMIEQAANMDPLLRWGNIFFGKLIELLWWGQEPRFTDVGCTYRAIWKNSYRKIEPLLSNPGPAFSPEMMIAVLRSRLRVIEIPVSYRQRLGGDSKHSADFQAKARTALKMLIATLKHRFGLIKPKQS
jgi:UDP-N-acetylglucosamine diphosphorylase / glucose-1-phosphate thymidylyltransferase / UDP-N-acetylgalactosamine diphosphorylase / glucosamine-1-phosphate N-acetyltransferase / galactosamine-1-phosphate N-acetyltransferase